MRATLWILVLCLWDSSQAKRNYTIQPKEVADLDHNKEASHHVIKPMVDVLDDAHFSVDLQDAESRKLKNLKPGDEDILSNLKTSGKHKQKQAYKTNPGNEIRIECIGSFSDPRNCKKFKFIFMDHKQKIRHPVQCGDDVEVKGKSVTGFLKMVFLSRHSMAEFSFVCKVSCHAAATTTTTTAPDLTYNPFSGTSCPANMKATCGVPSTSRIVGGTTTDITNYPWQAALVKSTSDPFCGGTIVNSKYIVTAAHCVKSQTPSSFKVVVGVTDILGNSERLDVESITYHESYSTQTLVNDIAVIELKEHLTFKDSVMPVCAPEADNAYLGKTATVSGWGTLSSGGQQPDKLNKVDLTIISFNACKEAYGTGLKAGMICAAASGKDSCQGDSGGPLVTEDEGTYVLVGAVSWGYGCADPAYPGVYTEVSDYLTWINDRVSSGGLQCE